MAGQLGTVFREAWLPWKVLVWEQKKIVGQKSWLLWKKEKKYNHNYGEIHEGISFIKLENDTFILANKAKIEKSWI
jgi:hypothetical protein